jgi:hypothetical protein
MDIPFDEHLVRRIFTASEDAVALRHADHVRGHTGARHSAVTNAYLYNRGGVATAFLDFNQAVQIGLEVLRKIPSADLTAIMDAKQGTPDSKRDFLVSVAAPYKIRVGGTGTALCNLFVIVIAKDVRMPYSLLIVTFFPKMSLSNRDFERII